MCPGEVSRIEHRDEGSAAMRKASRRLESEDPMHDWSEDVQEDFRLYQTILYHTVLY